MAPENGSHPAGLVETQQQQQQPLYLQYPANSSWEMSLLTGETVSGTVYCTDEVSQTVFLQKNLTHTTLATELRVLHAAHITRSSLVDTDADANNVESLSATALALGQLPPVQKKVLEEREKRAIKMAEESFRHINDKVRSAT